MKNIVTILALILCTFTLHAQFRMVGSAAAPGWSVVSATDYRANIIFGPDATGQGYTALLITDDFRLFTQTGQLYDIVSIDVPAGFSSIGITVREREGNWGIPSGVLQVYDPGNRRKIPACPVAGNGSNNQLLAAIISYNSNQSGGSGAEVLYVDKANYTGNPVIGDPSQPFETPWQASDYAQAGDVIEILSGNYIIVDSATYLTHPAYDVLVTSEDQYAYNLMKTDQLTYRFRSGTSIQFSAQEGYLAYDTLGYSMTIEGDWTLYTTEDNGVPFNVQGTNTAQTGTLKVEVSKMIDTRDHTLAVHNTSPRVFYLQNLQRFELNCDYITGSHRLLAWDGELSVQETYVDIGYWSQLYTDYPFLIQADTLRDQSHYIKIQNLDIPDFDFVFIEINRAYYWENTNFTFDIENAQVDRLTKATTTQGASDSEALKYSWIGGSFFTTANTLINSNITLDIENCYGNVPILNMTHAPDAITIDNFNYRIKGNWYYNTDYTNSTSTQGLFDIRDFFLPVDGVTIYMDGNFISLDTVPLIKFKTPDMVLKGTFKTQGDVPVIDIQSNATGRLDLIDAHLYNDGTVAEIQSSVPYNVNVDGSWNSPNLDPDVTINRYPIGGDMVQNLQTNGNWISGDGDNEGISVNSSGQVGIGTNSTSDLLKIQQPVSNASTTENGLHISTNAYVYGQHLRLTNLSGANWMKIGGLEGAYLAFDSNLPFEFRSNGTQVFYMGVTTLDGGGTYSSIGIPGESQYRVPLLVQGKNNPVEDLFVVQDGGAAKTKYFRVAPGGKIGLSVDPEYTLDVGGTDAIRLPVGTTAQRPTGANGLLRYNSSLSRLESYYNAEWNGLVDLPYLQDNFWNTDGTDIWNSNSGVVRIQKQMYVGTTDIPNNTIFGNDPSFNVNSNYIHLGSTFGTANGLIFTRYGSGGTSWPNTGATISYNTTLNKMYYSIKGTSSHIFAVNGVESFVIGQDVSIGTTTPATYKPAGQVSSAKNFVVYGPTAGNSVGLVLKNATNDGIDIWTNPSFYPSSASHFDTYLGEPDDLHYTRWIDSDTEAADTIYQFDSNEISFFPNGDGKIGINTPSPNAQLHLPAGTATANTAPLKFTSGTNLTTPEAGAMEWDGTNLYITQTTGPTRKTIAYTTDILSIQEITPATSTTITIDQQSKLSAITVVDMTTASTGSTITLSLSNSAPGVITIDFENTSSGMEIDFPSGFLDQTGATWDGGSTYSVTSDFFMTCYSTDGTTWKCK